MRKLSKILTVLLTMTMLFSAFAIFSFADSGEIPTLLKSPYSSKVQGWEDYESAKLGSYSPASSSTYQTNGKKGFGNSTGGSVAFSIEQQTNSNGVTNQYLTMSNTQATTSGYIDMYVGDAGGGYSSSSRFSSDEYDYMIIDFDFASLEYLYEVDGYTFHGKTYPENATNVRLAYAEKFRFSSSFRTNTNPGYGNLVNAYVLPDSNTNEWYISGDASLNTATDIKLSNKLGEWNHVTLVCKVVNDGKTLEKTFVAFYVNGQFLSENTFTNSANVTKFHADCVRFWYDVASVKDFLSISLDNITNNYYKKGYTSGDDVYGIDDFLNDKDYKTKNITSAMDIVYNEDYYYTGTENSTAATIIYEDNTLRTVPNVKKITPHLKNNAVVILNVPITDLAIDSTSGIETLTFKSVKSDAVLTLSASTRENYKLYHNGDTYVIRLKSAEDGIKIKWIKDVDTKTTFEVGYLLPYTNPNVDKFNSYNDLDMTNGKLKFIENWKITIPGTEYLERDAKEFSLSPAEICELKEIYGIDAIELIPNYKTIDLKYALTTSTVVEEKTVVSIYAPENDFSKFEDLTTLSLAAKKAPNGATLTFFADLSINSTVDLSVGTTLNVDINGNNLNLGATLFNVNEGVTLNVFGAGKITSSLPVVTIAKGVDACYVNFLGEEIGEDNNKTTVYCDFDVKTLVVFDGESTPADKSYVNRDLFDKPGKLNINIDGGNIKTSGQLFVTAAPHAVITIKNATIELNGNTSSAFAEATADADNKYYTAGNNISLKSTNVIAKDGATLFSVASSDFVKASFVDSKIIASIFDSKGSGVKITLGKDNVFSGNVFDYIGNLKFEADVNYAVNYGAQDKLLTIGEHSGVISLSTFVGEPTSEDIAKLLWYNPDGVTVYSVEYAYVGGKISEVKNPSAKSFDAVDTNNGWYILKYNEKWKIGTDVILAGENKFTPVLEIAAEKLDIKTNVEFFTNIAFNVYLKPFDTNTVVFDGFYVGGKKQDYFEKNGMICLQQILDAGSFESAPITIKFTVKYDADGDGNPDIEQNLERTTTFKFFEYVENIGVQFECGSKESTLALALVQYKHEAYMTAKTALGENPDQALLAKMKRILLGHGKGCACLDGLDNITFTAEENAITDSSYVNLMDYVDKFDYVISSKNDSIAVDHLAMVIYVKDSSVINEISAAYATQNLKFLKVSENEYRLSGITVADIDSIFTITITTNEGSVTGSYCLAEYIEKNNDKIVPKALYVISKIEE